MLTVLPIPGLVVVRCYQSSTNLTRTCMMLILVDSAIIQQETPFFQNLAQVEKIVSFRVFQ